MTKTDEDHVDRAFSFSSTGSRGDALRHESCNRIPNEGKQSLRWDHVRRVSEAVNKSQPSIFPA
jgi:hypothetical protein